MRVEAADYASLKAFFAWIVDRIFSIAPGLPPEDRPLALLERFEARSMAAARKGLGVAIGDIVETTDTLSPVQIRKLDAALAAEGLLSLSEVRARFSRAVAGILRRGGVRSERQYYALRNAVDSLPEAQQARTWRMLAAFEDRVAAKKPTQRPRTPPSSGRGQ